MKKEGDQDEGVSVTIKVEVKEEKVEEPADSEDSEFEDISDLAFKLRHVTVVFAVNILDICLQPKLPIQLYSKFTAVMLLLWTIASIIIPMSESLSKVYRKSRTFKAEFF